MQKLRPFVVTVAIFLGLAFAIYQIRVFFGPETVNGHLPADFPHAFLAPAKDGNYAAVVVWRGRIPPATLSEGGLTHWPVGVCRNIECPGRQDAQPYIFARGWSADAPEPHAYCVKCASATLDATKVESWFTSEGEAILVRVRASLGAK